MLHVALSVLYNKKCIECFLENHNVSKFVDFPLLDFLILCAAEVSSPGGLYS